MASRRINMERLDRARDAAGIDSDAALAARAEVNPSQITRWRGRGTKITTPSGDTVARLCRVLGVRAEWLFDEGEPADEPARDALDAALATVRPDERAEVARAVRLALSMMRAEAPVRAAPVVAVAARRGRGLTGK